MSYCILIWVMNMIQLRIRDLWEDHDLTQKQLADYLICDQSLYSKYERGERPFPLEFADNPADFYGVSVDYLMGRTGVKKPYPRTISGKKRSGRLWLALL